MGELYEAEWKEEVGGAVKTDTYTKNQEKIAKCVTARRLLFLQLMHILCRLFRVLCLKLDALSNTHYTPRMMKDSKLDVKMVKPSAPAIRMEEVTPITVSDATQLAPEEIFEKPETMPQGETEKTRMFLCKVVKIELINYSSYSRGREATSQTREERAGKEEEANSRTIAKDATKAEREPEPRSSTETGEYVGGSCRRKDKDFRNGKSKYPLHSFLDIIPDRYF